MTYTAADNRYDACRTAPAGAAACACPRSRWACGTTSVTHADRDPARHVAHRVRSGDHPLRPGEQLRTAVREGGDDFGRSSKDFAPYRDELIISTKAGWDMWAGPYGQGGGSRKYLLASLDQSLERMGLDYVDIFYSHRFDPETPLEETMGALATAVQQGKALYVGISSYSADKTRETAALSASWDPVPDPPADVQHAQPVDRGRPPRPRRPAGDGLIVFTPLSRAALLASTGTASPRSPAAGGEGAGDLSPPSVEGVRQVERGREGPRADAGADGGGVGAARPAGHPRYRREPARAVIEENVRAGQPGVHVRGADRDRGSRAGGRRQPVGTTLPRRATVGVRPGLAVGCGP